jgi:glucuronoarabinoxylan endo-1,4-beta-xylanase
VSCIELNHLPHTCAVTHDQGSLRLRFFHDVMGRPCVLDPPRVANVFVSNLGSDVGFDDGSLLDLSLQVAMVHSKGVSLGVRFFGKSKVCALLLTSSSVSVMLGCGGSDQTTPPGSGGGGVSVGGGNATGGSSAVAPLGGAPATGGVAAGTGGALAATGGTTELLASGGRATGGTPPVPTGGKAGNTGGAGVGGGNAATGGTRNETGGAAAGGGGGKAATGGAAAGGGGGEAATGGAAAGGAGGKAATGGAAAGGKATTGGAAAGGAGGKAATGGAGVGGGNPATGGSQGTAGSAGKTPGTPASGATQVNPDKTHQEMDGFGIADVWQGQSTSSAAQRTLFWDPNQGIGMTILRIGIDENGKIMGDAGFVEGPVVTQFGGKVWAAPWSPAASLKDNNNINNGGHLLTSAYETWASTLAAFPAYYKQNTGVDLWGISAQNEPDFVASYRSCIFSAAQMNAFIKVLGPKVKALNPPVHLLAAEPDVWSHTWDNGDRYGSAIEGDATVSSLVDIIATHDYGSNVSSTTRPSPPATMTHHLWQTEATYTAGAAIGPALDFARCIYAAVNSGGASGWVYWWTPEFMNGGSTTSPPKRVYAMGNFSKFVRPGNMRVDVTGAPSSVQVVAFKNPADNTVVIVVLNSGSSSVNLPVFVAGTSWPASVTPYVTSASSNLEAQTAITVNAANFTATIAAQSVTTFVGKP